MKEGYDLFTTNRIIDTMANIMRVVPRAITIDLDAIDANGNELLTTEDIRMLLTNYEGYINNSSRKLVLFRPKIQYGIGGGLNEEKKGRMQDGGKGTL